MPLGTPSCPRPAPEGLDAPSFAFEDLSLARSPAPRCPGDPSGRGLHVPEPASLCPWNALERSQPSLWPWGWAEG